MMMMKRVACTRCLWVPTAAVSSPSLSSIVIVPLQSPLPPQVQVQVQLQLQLQVIGSFSSCYSPFVSRAAFYSVRMVRDGHNCLDSGGFGTLPGMRCFSRRALSSAILHPGDDDGRSQQPSRSGRKTDRKRGSDDDGDNRGDAGKRHLRWLFFAAGVAIGVSALGVLGNALHEFSRHTMPPQLEFPRPGQDITEWYQRERDDIKIYMMIWILSELRMHYLSTVQQHQRNKLRQERSENNTLNWLRQKQRRAQKRQQRHELERQKRTKHRRKHGKKYGRGKRLPTPEEQMQGMLPRAHGMDLLSSGQSSLLMVPPSVSRSPIGDEVIISTLRKLAELVQASPVNLESFRKYNGVDAIVQLCLQMGTPLQCIARNGLAIGSTFATPVLLSLPVQRELASTLNKLAVCDFGLCREIAVAGGFRLLFTFLTHHDKTAAAFLRPDLPWGSFSDSPTVQSATAEEPGAESSPPSSLTPSSCASCASSSLSSLPSLSVPVPGNDSAVYQLCSVLFAAERRENVRQITAEEITAFKDVAAIDKLLNSPTSQPPGSVLDTVVSWVWPSKGDHGAHDDDVGEGKREGENEGTPLISLAASDDASKIGVPRSQAMECGQESLDDADDGPGTLSSMPDMSGMWDTVVSWVWTDNSDARTAQQNGELSDVPGTNVMADDDLSVLLDFAPANKRCITDMPQRFVTDQSECTTTVGDLGNASRDHMLQTLQLAEISKLFGAAAALSSYPARRHSFVHDHDVIPLMYSSWTLMKQAVHANVDSGEISRAKVRVARTLANLCADDPMAAVQVARVGFLVVLLRWIGDATNRELRCHAARALFNMKMAWQQDRTDSSPQSPSSNHLADSLFPLYPLRALGELPVAGDLLCQMDADENADVNENDHEDENESANVNENEDANAENDKSEVAREARGTVTVIGEVAQFSGVATEANSVSNALFHARMRVESWFATLQKRMRVQHAEELKRAENNDDDDYDEQSDRFFARIGREYESRQRGEFVPNRACQCKHPIVDPVDIVFVHGLLGRPLSTWRSDTRPVKEPNRPEDDDDRDDRNELVMGHVMDLNEPSDCMASILQPDYVYRRRMHRTYERRLAASRSCDEERHDCNDHDGDDYDGDDYDDNNSRGNVSSNRVDSHGDRVDEDDPATARGDEESVTDSFVCWPMDWLPRDVCVHHGNVRIFSIGYSTLLSRVKGTSEPLHTRSNKFIKRLGDAGIGQDDRRVIFVSHSLGGLLVKQMLVHSANRDYPDDSLARNCVGVVFFATPHFGSHLHKLSNIAGPFWSPALEIVEMEWNSPYLRMLNSQMAELVDDSDRIRDASDLDEIPSGHIRVLNFAEMRATPLPPSNPNSKLRLMVVSPDSANPGFGAFYMIDSDHLGICKPSSSQSFTYLRLVNFIDSLAGRKA